MNIERNENKPQDTLNDIRNMMERSTRFISLSGWSGIWAGLVALSGCIISFGLLNSYYIKYDKRGFFDTTDYITLRNNLFYLGVSVFVIALAGAFLFTLRKVRKQGLNVWNMASKRFLANLLIPIFAGGWMIVAFLYFGHWQYVAPACLVFYGLGLINASKFTLDDIRYLGFIEAILGGICLFFPSLGLYFWCIGFGVLHIIYGIVMWNKYDKQNKN